MKFFGLCLFVLSSFFAIAEPVPEEDRQYLQQDRDENRYGCVTWIRNIPQTDGWVDLGSLERVCGRYCRPVRAGDEEGIIVHCRGTTQYVINGTGFGSSFHCEEVANTQKEAAENAQSVCEYQARRNCGEIKECNINISCDPAKVCFNVEYDENDRPLIED